MERKELLEKLAEQGATISRYATTEKWADSDGKIYNVDFYPVDWHKVFHGEVYQRKGAYAMTEQALIKAIDHCLKNVDDICSKCIYASEFSRGGGVRQLRQRQYFRVPQWHCKVF